MGIQFDILLSFSIWPYITKFIESLILTSTQEISCSLGRQQSTTQLLQRLWSTSCINTALDPVSEDRPSDTFSLHPSKCSDCLTIDRTTLTTILDGVQQTIFKSKIKL